MGARGTKPKMHPGIGVLRQHDLGQQSRKRVAREAVQQFGTDGVGKFGVQHDDGRLPAMNDIQRLSRARHRDDIGREFAAQRLRHQRPRGGVCADMQDDGCGQGIRRRVSGKLGQATFGRRLRGRG